MDTQARARANSGFQVTEMIKGYFGALNFRFGDFFSVRNFWQVEVIFLGI